MTRLDGCAAFRRAVLLAAWLCGDRRQPVRCEVAVLGAPGAADELHRAHWSTAPAIPQYSFVSALISSRERNVNRLRQRRSRPPGMDMLGLRGSLRVGPQEAVVANFGIDEIIVTTPLPTERGSSENWSPRFRSHCR